jgi:hypothetical protein
VQARAVVIERMQGHRARKAKAAERTAVLPNAGLVYVSMPYGDSTHTSFHSLPPDHMPLSTNLHMKAPIFGSILLLIHLTLFIMAIIA